MSYQEKGVWVYLVVSAIAYLGYVVVVLGTAAGTPLSAVDYVPPLLISLGLSMLASVIGRVGVEMVKPSDGYAIDARDRQVGRLGETRASWFLIGAAIVAMILAILEQPYFWIANAIYLGFVLSAVVGSVVKLVAYRRGTDSSW